MDLGLIEPTGGVGFKDALNLVTDLPENLNLLLFAANRFRRIEKAPVMAIDLTRKNRACLIGIATNRNNRFDILLQKFIEVLGPMLRNIDADFGHNLDRKRMDIASWLAPGALDVDQILGLCPKNSFSKMASAGVARA